MKFQTIQENEKANNFPKSLVKGLRESQAVASNAGESYKRHTFSVSVQRWAEYSIRKEFAFKMAEVSEELIEVSARRDIRDLGAGHAFASLLIVSGQELTWSTAQGWPERTMALLLLLDLWIQNEDRSLTELGGNPNLLVEQIPPLPDDDPEGALWKVEARREMLWAYDFNLAFDPDFNRERFFGAHVFGKMLKQWPEGFREQMELRMKAALAEVPAIFAELPLEWLHEDGDESLPVHLDMKRVISVLELPFTNPATFWKLP